VPLINTRISSPLDLKIEEVLCAFECLFFIYFISLFLILHPRATCSDKMFYLVEFVGTHFIFPLDEFRTHIKRNVENVGGVPLWMIFYEVSTLTCISLAK
jgi:hypothetical protein